MSYKSCENCGDRKCAELMAAEGLDISGTCEDDWRPLPCPMCGGTLSGLRRSHGHFIRHCYSCNFDFPIDKHGNVRRLQDDTGTD